MVDIWLKVESTWVSKSDAAKLFPSYGLLSPWKIDLVIDWKMYPVILVSIFVLVGPGIERYCSCKGAWVSISIFGVIELQVLDEGPTLL